MRKTLLLTCACAVLLAGCGGAKKVATTTPATQPANADRFGCVKVAKPSLGVRTAPKPTAFLDVNKTYDVTMTTNCGDFTIRVDTHDLLSTTTIYNKGDVGMAKTGAQMPGTAGSQFFIVDAPNSGLPGGEYALIGMVVSGLNVVDHGIGLLGDPLTEQPRETVVIEHATVKITG